MDPLGAQLRTALPGRFAAGSGNPILITDQLDTIAQDERLMNLSREIPPGFSRFESLIEVVGQDEDDRSAARDRVKFYKDRGYDVRYFDLSNR